MCPISSRQGNRPNILDLKEPRNFLEDNDEDFLELLRSLSSNESTSNFDLHGIGEGCDFNGHHRDSTVMNNSAAVLSLGMMQEDLRAPLKIVSQILCNVIGSV